VSPGVDLDAARMAAAVTARPHVVGPHSGRFGEIATDRPVNVLIGEISSPASGLPLH
jgi:hypothetical protein